MTGAEAGGASSTAEVQAVARAGSPARTMAGSNNMTTCEVVGMPSNRMYSLLTWQAGRQA